jgi:hypothetical protein
MHDSSWKLMDGCPRCGVGVGEQCRNLKQPGKVPMWPHQERERLPEHMPPRSLSNHLRRKAEGRTKRGADGRR